jgi:hypothetical protein
MHDRGSNLDRGLIGDYTHLFVGLDPQANLHRIARANRVFRIKRDCVV